MWKLAALTLLWSTTAAAEPPAKACAATGPALVQVDRIKMGTPAQQQTTTIYASGGWATADTTAGAKPESGCVPHDDFEALKSDLAKAPWQVTRAKIHCMAMSAVHTEYKYRDKLVWSARLCSGETLDKASEAAVEELDKLVDKLVPNRQKL
ncbi:MAG TPA: hypothetical protein VGG74_20030 [Kofleriaceae bacterium]|jgi:hypothetical protein